MVDGCSFLPDKMAQYDPKGIFLNNFGRRLKGDGTTLDSDPEATRCALLDYCFCSKDSDCGPQQRCGEVPKYPGKPVCRTPNDEKIVSLIQAIPLPSNILQWAIRVIPNLISQASTQCLTSGLLRWT
jgi:hypothetical protein